MPPDTPDPGRAVPGATTRPAARGPDRPTAPGAPASPAGSEAADPAQGSAGYRDRPADEGKHGDAAEEPNAGVP